MIGTICLKTNVVILLMIILGFIVYIYQQHIEKIKKESRKSCKPCKPCKPCQPRQPRQPRQPSQPNNRHNVKGGYDADDVDKAYTPERYDGVPNVPFIDGHGRYVDPVRIQDNKNLLDPYKYPEKRLDRHNLYLKNLAVNYKAYGLHSQGYPDTPILRGYLYENKPISGVNKRILPLFGYETYPNSRRYKYYTVLEEVGLDIAPKIEIEFRIENGNPRKLKYRELYDDDVVVINKLEDTRFTVRMVEHDEIRHYSPI